MKVALIGNPNVGKTSVFNILTGSNQYVGNWAGVTIEKKVGYIDKEIEVVDLPGIYAMDTYSNEEKIAKEFIQNEDVDVILNIVDATTLERNLYLTTQLMEFNKPIIILLNMVDIIEKRNYLINYELLEKSLGVKIVPISAKKNSGFEKLKDEIEKSKNSSFKYHSKFNSEFEAYKFIEDIVSKAVVLKKETIDIGDKIDKIVLNPILAYPIFLMGLFLIFKFTFNWFGQPLADLLDRFISEGIVPMVSNLLSNSSEWFKSLILDGIVAGVGGVIVFFPIVFALFLGISFLEDSGYMSRVAFIMDTVMKKIGLSGKAFIPIIMGFGCSAPAIMATRTLESEKDRKLTALIAPLVSCGARLPVYALFASIFFVGKEEIVVMGIYLLGVIIAILVGLLFKKTIFSKEDEPFILELPKYKMPSINAILKNTWEKSKGFIIKAGTLIFSISILVWFLTYFNINGFTRDIDSSFLASFGGIIAPIFKPLGFGTWEAGVSIISGLAAKEVIIGTLQIVYGNLNETLPSIFTLETAIAFLVFVSLYTPCFAVIGTMKKEYGNKMMLFSVAYQFILAWVVSYIVRYVATVFLGEVTVKYTINFITFIIGLFMFLTILIKKTNYQSNTEKLNFNEDNKSI